MTKRMQPTTPIPSSYGSMEDVNAPAHAGPAPVAFVSVDKSGKSEASSVTLDDEMDAIGFGRFHYLAIAILGLANASDAVELLCLSFILPSLPAEDISDSARAALSASIFVGMLIGGLVFGTAGDALGRRSMLALSLMINAFFGLLSAASPDFPVLFLCRVLSGFGVGGSIPGVFSLAAELLPAKHRGYALSCVASCWMFGSLYAAGTAWLMIGRFSLPWQLYAAVAAIPAGLGAIAVRLGLPESPRYLLLKGDTHAAAQSMLWIARVNRTESRLSKGYVLADHIHVQGQQDGGGQAAAEADAESSSLLSGDSKVSSASSESAVDMPSSPSKRGEKSLAPSSPIARRAWCVCRGSKGCSCSCRGAAELFSSSLVRCTALLLTVWFALSFGWYGLNLWLPTLFAESDVVLDPYQDSFLAQAATLPGNILSILLMDKVGRKRVLVASLFASCAATAALPFARSEVAAVAVACTMNAVSTCTWNALDCLSTESFPTHLRTTAMGVLSASGRVGSIVGQLVFGALIHVSVGALLGSAAGMLGLAALAAMALAAETAKERLKD